MEATQQETPPESPEVALDTGAEDEEQYIPKEPSKGELKAARAVLSEMKKRGDKYTEDETVSALLQLTDILEPYRTPEAWPAGEKDEYCEAPVVETIGTALIMGCEKLTLPPDRVVYLFRNKDKWMDGERPKRGDSKKFDTRTQYLLDGAKVAVEINYHHWLGLNPLQKVQTIYHELRKRGADGVAVAPDFSGYFDELELFGVRTFHELMELGQSITTAELVEHPHQLTLFTDGEGAEA